IASYKDTGKVPNVVNLAKRTPATHMLVVRHRDRPGVLAHVFEHLRSGDINVQETENVIFEGAQAAVARINLDGAPSDALLAGMSILEISHRSTPFEAILAQAEADIRTLGGVPPSYKVVFLQGGASTQFSMVPMNLLTAGATADYIDSGSWAEKAIKEAKKVGSVNVAATTKGENYSRVPRQNELKLTPGAAYVHMTSNNTIEGTEYKELPLVGDVPLVSDTSSDMLSRPMDVARHALIYS